MPERRHDDEEARMDKPFPYLSAYENGFVFIVTYGRSGSTLLQNILNSIPGYCIRGENNAMLNHLAMSWDSAQQTAAYKLPKGEVDSPERPWYGAGEIRPYRYGRTLANMFVRDVLRPPAGTRAAGFKEIRFHGPGYWQTMDFITRFFPKAKIIYNTRNHADVCRSGWMKEMKPERAKAELDRAERLFAQGCKRFPKQTFTLKYEDYAGAPEGLEPLFDFLKEPFDLDHVAPVVSRRLTHTGTPVPAMSDVPNIEQ